jgi:hypothetical protein
MKPPARHLSCVHALVFTAVTAVTLAACSGDPGAMPTAEPTPNDSTTSIVDQLLTPTESAAPTAYPSATDPAQIANNVALWYESGGKEELTGVRGEAEAVYSHHDDDFWFIDFSRLFDQVHEAQEYPPIPDRKTQAAWSAALKHVSNGGGDVFNATRFGTAQSQSAERAKQEAQGWKELAEGIKGLKAVEARLHRTFGLDPLTAP